MENRAIGLMEALESIFQAYLQRVCGIAHLAGLEARLAGKTVILMVFSFLLLGCLLLSTWVCINGLLFIAIVSFVVNSYKALIAASSLTLLNLSLVFLTIIWIAKKKKNLTFPGTREELKVFGKSGEMSYEQIKTSDPAS